MQPQTSLKGLALAHVAVR